MTIKKKIEEIRGQITALEAQLSAPEHSGMSRAEVRESIVAQIDAWHDQATDRIADDLQKLAAGADPEMLTGSVLEYLQVDAVPGAVRSQALDNRALLTWTIGKAAMLARFKPLLDEMPEGLDAATRAQRVDEINRQRVAAEIREEALLREADAQSVDWTPRPGQRPEAAILIGYGQ